jgi:serine/threonine-protein kinase
MTTSTREQRRQLFEQYIGQVVAQKYTLSGLLGFGGMGAVYEAIQAPMDRKVALKLIPTHDPTAAARFEREAYTISRLTHPNTVTVFDFGQTGDGQLFLSMEYLEGRTLTELIRDEGPLPGERVVMITDQICRSLAEAHRAGIIHRDVKPDNIVLVPVDGNPDYVKVLDFGIAKAVHGEEDTNLTADGRIVGTPKYMSPEQILANPTDHRADIYSLGCIMHEMLTGQPPFEGNSSAKLMMSHAQQPPPQFSERLAPNQLTDVVRKLEAVVRRAMAKNPDERPATTDDLRREMALVTSIPLSFTGTNPALSTPNLTPPSFDQPRPAPSPSPTGNTSYPFENQTGNFPPQTGSFAQPGGAQGMAPPPAAEPASSKTNTLLIVGVLLLMLIGGGLAFAIFGLEDKTPEPPEEVVENTPADTKAEETKDPEVTPDTPADTPDEEPKKVDEDPDAPRVFKIISDPKGADVTRDGKKVGTTPMTVEVAADDDPSIYRIQLEGYEPEAVQVDPGATRRTLVVALTKDIDGGKPSGKKRTGGKKRPPKDSGSKKVENKTEDPASNPVEEKPKTPSIDLLDDDDTTKVKRLD